MSHYYYMYQSVYMVGYAVVTNSTAGLFLILAVNPSQVGCSNASSRLMGQFLFVIFQVS